MSLSFAGFRIVLGARPLSSMMLPALALGLAVAGCEDGRTAERTKAPRTGGKVDMSKFVKPTEEALRKSLSSLQYRVTQEEGTERAFQNEYWDNKKHGIYVDVVSGEPLFSSLDKFDSGTGWPSFTKPLESENVVTREDSRLGMTRIEARSRYADSHLGHVFPDGPKPTGQRYCMNSAALRFIPVEELADAGYGAYREQFEKAGVLATDSGQRETALLAGGCFWGMEDIIRNIPGVIETQVGYTGGDFPHPTYEDVKRGKTGHAESIQVVFDPQRLSYEDLLRTFFRMHDPTTMNRQGNDRGAQYRSAIFYASEAQKEAAERVRSEVDAAGKWPQPIVTEIVAASDFWPAEDYHQDYLVKHPGGYSCHWLRPL